MKWVHLMTFAKSPTTSKLIATGCTWLPPQTGEANDQNCLYSYLALIYLTLLLSFAFVAVAPKRWLNQFECTDWALWSIKEVLSGAWLLQHRYEVILWDSILRSLNFAPAHASRYPSFSQINAVEWNTIKIGVEIKWRRHFRSFISAP